MNVRLRPAAAVALVLALVSGAAADVLILRGGTKVAGAVKEEKEQFVVKVEGEELTFTKDEVEKWCKSPKDLLGDEPDRAFEDAKSLYQEAVDPGNEAGAQQKLREALARVRQASDAYQEARELFPEGYPELDEKLNLIMQLIRLIRGSLKSEKAVEAPISPKGKAPLEPPPAAGPAPEPNPPVRPRDPLVPPEVPLTKRVAAALAVAAAPERRAIAAEREAARDALGIRRRDERSPLLSFGAALGAFLSRDDKGWRLVADRIEVRGPGFEQRYAGRLVKKSDTAWSLFTGVLEVRLRKDGGGWMVTPPGGSEFKPTDLKIAENVKSAAFEGLQEYLTGRGLAEVGAFTAEQHLQQATLLLEKGKAARGADGGAGADAFFLFAAAHLDALLAASAPDAAVFQAAQSAGWGRAAGGSVVGTPDGIAIDAYHRWMDSGFYDMAIVEFRRTYSASADLGVRYVLGMLYMFRALSVNRQYDRAYLQFEKMAQTAPNARVKEHLLALAQSIRAAAPCKVCAGTHEIRCPICHGNGRANFMCRTCGGAGRVFTVKGDRVCSKCGGRGRFENLDCPKCKTVGKLPCKGKGCTEPVPQPTIDSFCEALECSLCGGRGTLFDNVALPCTECFGVGLFLLPKSAPTRTIR